MLRVPQMCTPYVQQCFGSVTPALVAKPCYADGMDPELLWPLSYHTQEQVLMTYFSPLPYRLKRSRLKVTKFSASD